MTAFKYWLLSEWQLLMSVAGMLLVVLYLYIFSSCLSAQGRLSCTHCQFIVYQPCRLLIRIIK